MSNAPVSVVVPLYNLRHLVGMALDSIYAQSALPEEIIVVDDGSTDGGGEFVRETYSDIRVIQRENGGLSSARNAGIRAASSEFIAFLDADDTWEPECLRILLDLVRKYDARVAAAARRHVSEAGDIIKAVGPVREERAFVFPGLLRWNFLSSTATVLHKSLFETRGHFDETLPVCEDHDFWLRIALHEKFALTSEIVTNYVERSSPERLTNRRQLFPTALRQVMLKFLPNLDSPIAPELEGMRGTLRSECWNTISKTYAEEGNWTERGRALLNAVRAAPGRPRAYGRLLKGLLNLPVAGHPRLEDVA